MVKNDNVKYQKVSNVFNCMYCDYNTSYKSNLVKHNSTLKHKMVYTGIYGVADKIFY